MALKDEKVSRALSRILRHKAEAEGFKLMPGGFLYVDEILQHKIFKATNLEQIQRIVETNDKQRFMLQTDAHNGRLMIRANQGHSLQVEDLELRKITDASEYPVVVHGTYWKQFRLIGREGLKPMGRNHVHFAAGEPGENGVISGMRGSCTVMIYIDLDKALQDGFEFFVSANDVILCPGNQDGVIPTMYFKKVVERQTGKHLSWSGPCGTEEQGMLPLSGSSDAQTQINSACPTPAGAMAADDIADEFEKKKRKGKKQRKKCDVDKFTKDDIDEL